MKRIAYFFLFCGLLSQIVFGESVPRNKPVKVVKYIGFYNSSQLSVTRRTKPQVIVGTFGSIPVRVLNSSSQPSRWQASGVDKKENTEMLLGKNSVFFSPAVIVLR